LHVTTKINPQIYIHSLKTPSFPPSSSQKTQPPLTTMALFDPSLIPQSIISQLPPGYIVRPLQKSDYTEGFLDVLRVLTTVGDISDEAWATRYEWIEKRSDEYYLIVVLDESREQGKRVVGTGCLVVERKL
jgi:glucosamine-phosphate N-acetyltransferase